MYLEFITINLLIISRHIISAMLKYNSLTWHDLFQLHIQYSWGLWVELQACLLPWAEQEDFDQGNLVYKLSDIRHSCWMLMDTHWATMLWIAKRGGKSVGSWLPESVYIWQKVFEDLQKDLENRNIKCVLYS